VKENAYTQAQSYNSEGVNDLENEKMKFFN